MANKIFGKILDVIGLEESTLEEEEMYEDEYDDEGEDDYEVYNPKSDNNKRQYDYDDEVAEEEEEAFSAPTFARSGVIKRKEKDNKVVGLAPNNKMKLIIYQPMSYDDTQSIIDNLKNRKAVVVNLESLESDVAQRILDFMSGAVYAVNGNIHKVSKGIFVLVPNNVDISGNIPDELQGTSFYSLGNKQKKYDI